MSPVTIPAPSDKDHRTRIHRIGKDAQIAELREEAGHCKIRYKEELLVEREGVKDLTNNLENMANRNIILRMIYRSDIDRSLNRFNFDLILIKVWCDRSFIWIGFDIDLIWLKLDIIRIELGHPTQNVILISWAALICHLRGENIFSRIGSAEAGIGSFKGGWAGDKSRAGCWREVGIGAKKKRRRRIWESFEKAIVSWTLVDDAQGGAIVQPSDPFRSCWTLLGLKRFYLVQINSAHVTKNMIGLDASDHL